MMQGQYHLYLLQQCQGQTQARQVVKLTGLGVQTTYLYDATIQVPQGVTTKALAQALETAAKDGSLNVSALGAPMLSAA